MKRLRFTALMIAVTILLCSCKMLELDSDALLNPPQMNAADSDLLRVIESKVSTYVPAYPKYGGYQNAVNFADLNGDNINEAVCFYTDGSDKTVKFIVLETVEGKWALKGTGTSGASAVDRISFCDLDGDGVNELIIGWQFISSEEKALEVFGFGDSEEMDSLYTGIYNSFIVYDREIIIISRNTGGKTASASVVGSSKAGVSVLSTVTLNNSITSFISVQSGELPNSKHAVFIDEQLESMSYTTEILIAGENGELAGSAEEISLQTTRTRAYVCTDVNGDDRPDLPVEHPLPEYERGGTMENLSYVEWYDYDGGGLSLLTRGCVSVNEQYMITLPAEWIGSITIQRHPEAERTLCFYEKRGSELSPMFSVRVFSQQEYSDEFKDAGWTAIANSGENVYAYKNDGSPEGFETNAEMITELFVLLS